MKIEKQKLIEQAKRIARPSANKSIIDEICLFNSMVTGIQNYFQSATCISLDCRTIHRQIMTVLTNRLNKEKECRLVRSGGTMTKTEKERYGRSKMVRYVAGIDQCIYPIAYIKNKIPKSKKTVIRSYTVEGRAEIHTNLTLNSSILKGILYKTSGGHSTEYCYCMLSLFSAQKGKCALSGEEFQSADNIECILKTPIHLGGHERYKNMLLCHTKYKPLLLAGDNIVLKELAKTLNTTAKLMKKVNNLRNLSRLEPIE